jgi:hypothetical protein
MRTDRDRLLDQWRWAACPAVYKVATDLVGMAELLELFQMAAMNHDALTGLEKLPILKARLALQMFERAMLAFKNAPQESRVTN